MFAFSKLKQTKRTSFLSAHISSSTKSLNEFRKEILEFERSERVQEQSPFSTDFELPFVKEYQQTIRRCITLRGIGLHTADCAFIRIRPAKAGEGRYFVIVPKGLISESPAFISESEKSEDGDWLKHSERPENEWKTRNKDQSVEAFLTYCEAKSKGYEGSVEEFEETFFQNENHALLKEMKKRIDEDGTPEDFEIVPQLPGDIIIPATIQSARGELYFTVLEHNAFAVTSVEHLLAALEACGVDNCRIEIEGGREVPIIDGSAHGWTTLIVRVGVVSCKEKIRKGVVRINKPLVITGENGSFISATPSKTTLITAGWDAISRGAASLGRSWYTWDIDHDYHFHYSVAPAKTFYHSEFELDALYDSGLVQAGPTLCAIVAMGQTVEDPSEVTFPHDEASRHKIIDFTGDLALLSSGGQGGIPIGHLVAWNADHVLQLKFCVHLWREIVRSCDSFFSYNPAKNKLRPRINSHIPLTLSPENCDEKFSRLARENEDLEEKAQQHIQMAMAAESLLDDFGKT